MLYIAAMARETVDKSEITRQRLRRAAAAAYLTDKLGPTISPNTLRSWPIAYKQLGRDATYEIRDLDAFAEARIAAAAVRRAGPSPDFAALYEERRRLIAGNGSEEEARLRALEYTAGVASKHYGCDIGTAARLVRDRLKEKV